MDLLTTTSGNTFDKTINCSFNLFTSNKNDTVIVYYGDNSQEQIQLTSNIIPDYIIPSSILSPITNPATNFLLLNNEFHNDTYLFGFEFYSVSTGIINIKVRF